MTSDIALNFCNPEVVKGLQVIHYGSDRFDVSKFREVKNNTINGFNRAKPFGGLWACPVNSKNSWRNCCLNLNMFLPSLQTSFKLKFHKSAKIALVNNYKDLANLPMVKEPKNEGETFIDWEIIKLHADAIWLTSKGVHETMYSVPYCLRDWYCESVVILNPQICFSVLE